MQGKRKLWHWLVLGILSLIWGTSYILMKKGLESFSAFQIASLRVIITTIALLPVALHNLHRLNRDNLKSVLIIGFFGSGIPAFLFPLAQTRIDSSLAGMLNSLSPVFTFLIGLMFYSQKFIKSQVAGLFLGLVGAIGLLYSDTLTFNHFGLFVVLAAFLSGISSNEVSKVKGLNGLQITSLAFLIMSPVAVLLFLSTDYHGVAETENWLRNLGFIAILACIGSAFALSLFYLLVRDTSPVFATMVNYFIPIVATFWGVLDGESLTSLVIPSLLLIFCGVYLVNRPGLLKNLRNMLK
jgi:drug/metabolite transporter (DMT)-like permease